MRKAFYPPLKHSNRVKRMEDFGVFDIEAKDWTTFLGLVAYSEAPYTLEIFSNRNNKTPKDFINWLFSEDNTIDTWFAHFGGGYDFLFILEDHAGITDVFLEDIISLGSTFMTFSLCQYEEVTKKDYVQLKKNKRRIVGDRYMNQVRKIKFFDSGKFLPFALNTLTNSFNVVHKKLDDIDAGNLEVWNDKCEEYCIFDCKGLYEVLDKYFTNELIMKSGPRFTTASQSVAYLKTTMEEDDLIPSLQEEDDEFVRKSYFGGRTEIYNMVFDGDENNLLNYYDINSLYPSVMIDNYFGYEKLRKPIRDFNDDYISFFECDVIVPKDLYIGPLPIYHEVNKSRKTIFPVGKFRGVWSTIELENALSYGVKIDKIHNAVSFHKGKKIFHKAINHLYEKRKASEKNSVDNILTKLIMNSMYGKFGINRHRENIEVFNPKKHGGLVPEYTLDTEIGEFNLVKTEKILENSFGNVAIASQVTSYARVKHYNEMMALSNVYNCDTDSYWTTDELETGDELGEIKLEDRILRACFLLPKTYTMDIVKDLEKSLDTKTINKMKGFPKEVMNQFSHEDFISNLHGEALKLKADIKGRIMKPKAAMSRGSFLKLMPDSTKQIRSMYDKRKVIFNSKTDVTTEPWIMKNGEIINQ